MVGKAAKGEETERAVGVIIGTRPPFAFATMEPVVLNRGLYVRGYAGCVHHQLCIRVTEHLKSWRRLLIGSLRHGCWLLWSTESGVKDEICGIPALLGVGGSG